ncbi:MAG: SMP-30/gluconolactonase/LRE family protein [Gemmatimonadota bacterium]|nr:SMP-30/gluconolactonase/LRE family protein [Gemmatimonadota bacterium]
MAEVALAARARLGEGPAWDGEAAVLWWVDILNHRVHRFRPDTGEDEFWEVGETVGCAVPAAGGRVLLGLRRGLGLLDPGTGEVERLATLLDGAPGERINDGKCDPRGRLWVGSMSQEEGGAVLFRYDPEGGARVVERGLTISNGLGWSPDGGTFYLTDSPRKTIYAYDFDLEAGEISGRRVFADLSAGKAFPDGLTVDAEGCVWSAQWEGGSVVRFSPDGREVERRAVPVPLSTSCAFGGPDLGDLYVTSASVGLGQEQIEESHPSGDLFRLRPGAKGLPVTPFRVP